MDHMTHMVNRVNVFTGIRYRGASKAMTIYLLYALILVPRLSLWLILLTLPSFITQTDDPAILGWDVLNEPRCPGMNPAALYVQNKYVNYGPSHI